MKQIYQTLRLTFAIFILAVTCTFAQQNRGTIKGRVLTSDNKPADNVTVSLKGTKYGTITNENGEYNFKAAAGSYTLVVSYVGVQSIEVPVTVTANQTLSPAVININNSMAELEVVNVTGNRINKLAARKSPYVAKMPLANLENPQVFSSVSKELIAEQLTTNFSDALKNTPGLDRLWSSTGRAGDGAAYYTLRGFTIQPTLIDGIAGLTNGDLDPSNIERIEVIKGPSGTLFGGALTNFGGLINIVTKKPAEDFGGQFSYSGGNYSLSRLTADVNGPISKDKKLLGRVNAAYHYQNSFQDAGFRKSLFIAPALEYRATDKLTLNFNAEFYNYEGTNPLMVFLNRSRQLIARTPDELNFNFNRSYTSNDITVKTPAVNIRGVANYKLSDQWTSQTSFSSSNRKTDGFNQYVMYDDRRVDPTKPIIQSDTLLSRYASLQNSVSTAVNVQQNFNGDFKIGGMRNRIVLGLDFLNQITNNNNSPYIFYDYVSSVRNDPRYTAINQSSLTTRIGASTAGYVKNRTLNNIYSVYASDVLNLTDRLLAMLSLRVDRFDNRGTYTVATNATAGNFKQTAVSPKLGLVYQLIKDQVSVFGNYMNGFKNVAPLPQPLPDISGTFKPQQANQLEGGVKLNTFQNRLTLTASYYNISVDNTVRQESIERDGQTYNINVQDGTRKSEGVELDVITNPIDGLNIVTGYAYNYSSFTKSAASVLGRRPVDAGPTHLANLWVSYTLLKGNLSGLGAGFGGNYAGKNIITNTVATGKFTLPAYTVLNATAFYNTKHYRLGLKVDNLTNKQYFKGWTTVEPQMPLSVVANLTYKF